MHRRIMLNLAFLKGLHLDDETRNKVKDLKEKISDLCIEFSKNCNEEATKLTFTAEQLSKRLSLLTFDALITFNNLQMF
jgi:Zn-dependent oligopeptidase